MDDIEITGAEHGEEQTTPTLKIKTVPDTGGGWHTTTRADGTVLKWRDGEDGIEMASDKLKPKAKAKARGATAKQKNPKTQMCPSCGKAYEALEHNFPKINTPQTIANGGYAHICMGCLIAFYSDKLSDYGKDSVKAIKRCCQLLNIGFDKKTAEQSVGGITDYLRRRVLAKIDKQTYDATIEADERMLGVSDVSIVKPQEEVPPEAYEIFGEGFEKAAYLAMMRSYNGYVDVLGGELTVAQRESAAFLAALKYRTMDAIRRGDQNASSLSSALNKAIKDSGFDVVQSVEPEAKVDPLGVIIQQIEQYTPAEYVKKNPYKDVDGMDAYFDRFVRRPIENLLRKSSSRQGDPLDITDEEASAVDVSSGDGDEN